MKATPILCVVLVSFAASRSFAQSVFTRWDFNAAGLSSTSPAPTLANQGVEVAVLIGGTVPGTSGAFLLDNGSSDVGTGKAWNITNFPLQGTASGTAGAEFRTDATGFASISFEMDLKATGTFSDYIAVQYSLDHGGTWTTFNNSPYQLPGNTNATATQWTNNIGSGSGGVPLFLLPATADNAPDVRVRFVTVFDPALGNAYSPNSPTNGAGAPQSYQQVGSTNIDMVEFKGAVFQGASPSIAMGASGVTPSSTCAGANTPVVVSVAVVPGTGPASTSMIVSADMSAVGGSAAAAMTPAGVDANARWLFELAANVAPSTPTGPRPIHVSAVDDHSRTANADFVVNVAACCPADLDNDGSHANGGAPDGGVDINDLLFFLAGFEAGAADVDLDNDGDPAVGQPDGGVDINDLLFFLARFEGGC